MEFLRALLGKSKKESVLETDDDSATGADSVGTTKAVAEPIHVTDESFEHDVLRSEVPVLVDFWAPWCGPCRMIAPIVEDLAQAYDGRAIVAKMNTDENGQMASSLGIMGIPTLIYFKDGKEVDRVVGFAPKQVFESKMDAVLH